MTGSDAPSSFRLAYVPGVTPGKWVRIWNERLPDVPLHLRTVPSAEAADLLRRGEADAGFLRLPADRAELSVIPLYTETTVVVVPKEHAVAAVDEVAPEELADEIVLHPLDDVLPWERPPGRPARERPATTADAVELVAAGVGLLVVPQSLARLHHRRDLTYRPMPGAAESRVGLAWPEERTTDQVEDFIGIVRGRTVNSSRGRPTPPQPKAKPKPKRADAGGAGRAGTAGRNARRGGPKGDRRGKPRRRSR
ncbi:LysR family substrate-binding domain-containing protein [Streptomyces marincola]|uniref:LysR family transcriptional regulator n=1 Tax=Streptomyces marincola TaxID=2878388 RepID=A0A1W7CYL7_9ACTN|nr:LysR family substrate-binding domain-containing protein [Streptomyces marincola]ARQ69894.1 LysR family transcriptional regulator [Streptomyces marincola]